MDVLVMGSRGGKGETICLLFVYVSLAPFIKSKREDKECVCVGWFVWEREKGQEVMEMVTGNLLIDRAGLAIYQHDRRGGDDDNPPLFAHRSLARWVPIRMMHHVTTSSIPRPIKAVAAAGTEGEGERVAVC